MDKKIVLRTKAKELRKTLNIESISTDLVNKIRQTDEYKKAKHILLFHPKKFEINLLDLLNDNKNFFLPKVNGNILELCPYKLGDKLQKSKIGVFEPTSMPVNIKTIELLIVPALLVDKQGYRLGYGGGYYDRLLKETKTIPSICAISDKLVVENLPIEEHDIKITKIITA